MYTHIYVYSEDSGPFIGWSNNNFNNLHFIHSLETNTQLHAQLNNRRCFANLLKRRLLK